MSFGNFMCASAISQAADIVPIGNTMPFSFIAQPPSLPKSPALALSIKEKMDNHGDIGLLGEHFDPGAMAAGLKEDGYESRSGSDNFEGASGDDQDNGEDGRPRKKKYHRHTQEQIKELDAFFQENAHPDEKQRLELSRRLGLETKQIKFWFQNRRTQMKTQLERHENMLLKQENNKLVAENELLKQNMTDPICNSCGGPVVPGPVSYEQQQLRIENARLKDELSRVCALAHKFLGRPLSSVASPLSPFGSNSKLELGVGRNGLNCLGNIDTSLPVGLDFNDGGLMPLLKPMIGGAGNDSMFLDLALAAMDELVKMAQPDSSLWIRSMDGGMETLNFEEYGRTFTPCIGRKPGCYVTEATRETGIVYINSLALVEILMDANRWAGVFSGLIARASTISVISSGIAGTKNGTLQVMHGEFQVISPLVPVRQVKFLRFCKQHAEGVWAVVDISIDANQENFDAQTFLNCRRLPSGCIVQDMPNGGSKVTWVEHSEYDESAVHQLYRSVLSSGRGFGAQRWMGALQRYCDCSLLLSAPLVGEAQTMINLSGRKNMLKLAQRMVVNFCSGVCASSARKWDKLKLDNLGEDVRILTRKSINEPGEPDGILLSAAISLWLPVTQQRLFDFLKDERSRGEWDILSHSGMMQEMVRIPKAQGDGNCISLLRSIAVDGSPSEGGMVILQETWNDASGSLIVYAPVDIPSMSVVMNGGDPTYVVLLPSGFVILPDDSFSQRNGTAVRKDGNGSDGVGSLLTVGFQILVNNIPTSKLTVESVDTVNNLVSCTIQRIKSALQLT